MATNEQSHQQRVKEELMQAGMSRYGLHKLSSRYLHNLIHPDEHIAAVVYGRYSGGTALLVATDRRVIFLDHKPLFTTSDELTYEVVSGVKLFSGLFASLTLHTRIQDYTLRYVNKVAADRFVHFIEAKRIEVNNPYTSSAVEKPQNPEASPSPEKPPATKMDNMEPAAKAFLTAHDTAVISTVGRTGNVSGTVVYYMVDQNDMIFILTRSGTAQARDIVGHQQIGLTVFEADPPRTLQMHGIAEIETDPKARDNVLTQMIQPHPYQSGKQLPPVSQLKAEEGVYVVIRITLTSAAYHAYQPPPE